MAKADPIKEERYTPSEYVALVKKVLRRIYLDPFSCKEANRIVKASTYYTREQDGLKQDWDWADTIFLNPPYRDMSKPVEKLISWLDINRPTQQAIMLCNAATDTRWFHRICSVRYYAHVSLCIVRGRIQFYQPKAIEKRESKSKSKKTRNQPEKPSLFVYFGKQQKLFGEVFSSVGEVVGL